MLTDIIISGINRNKPDNWHDQIITECTINFICEKRTIALIYHFYLTEQSNALLCVFYGLNNPA